MVLEDNVVAGTLDDISVQSAKPGLVSSRHVSTRWTVNPRQSWLHKAKEMGSKTPSCRNDTNV